MLHLSYAIRFKKIIIRTYKEIEDFFCGKKNINKQKIADRIQEQIDKIINNEVDDNVKKRKTVNKKQTLENNNTQLEEQLTIEKKTEDSVIQLEKSLTLNKKETLKPNSIPSENKKIEIIKRRRKTRIPKNPPKRIKKQKTKEVEMKEIENIDRIKIEDIDIKNNENIKEVEIKKLNERKSGRRILGSNPPETKQTEINVIEENIKNEINEEKENVEIKNIKNEITEEINIEKERENIEKLLEKRNLKTKIKKEDNIKETTINYSIVDLFNSLKKDYNQKKTNESTIEKKMNNSYTLNDIYKRTINKQIQNKFNKPTKVDYNSYTPKTDIPIIDSDDQDRMVPSFLKPEWTKGSVLQEILKKQTHEQLENFYKTEDVDITLIFPYVSDITNYSPNKIKYRKYTSRQI